MLGDLAVTPTPTTPNRPVSYSIRVTIPTALPRVARPPSSAKLMLVPFEVEDVSNERTEGRGKGTISRCPHFHQSAFSFQTIDQSEVSFQTIDYQDNYVKQLTNRKLLAPRIPPPTKRTAIRLLSLYIPPLPLVKLRNTAQMPYHTTRFFSVARALQNHGRTQEKQKDSKASNIYTMCVSPPVIHYYTVGRVYL